MIKNILNEYVWSNIVLKYLLELKIKKGEKILQFIKGYTP